MSTMASTKSTGFGTPSSALPPTPTTSLATVSTSSSYPVIPPSFSSSSSSSMNRVTTSPRPPQSSLATTSTRRQTSSFRSSQRSTQLSRSSIQRAAASSNSNLTTPSSSTHPPSLASSQVIEVITTTMSGSLNREGYSSSGNYFAHNSGAIAGLTVGILAVIGFMVLWLLIARRRRAKQRELDALESYGARSSHLDDDPYMPPPTMSTPYHEILTQMRPTLFGSIESHEEDEKIPYLLRRESSSGNGHQSSSAHGILYDDAYVEYPAPVTMTQRDSRMYSAAMPGLSSAEWLGGRSKRASGSVRPTPLNHSHSSGFVAQHPESLSRTSPVAPSIGAPSSASMYYTPRGTSPSRSHSVGGGSSSERGWKSAQGSDEVLPRQKSNLPPTSFLFGTKTSESRISESGKTKGLLGRLRSRSLARKNTSPSESDDSHEPSTFRELAMQSTPTVFHRSSSPSQSQGIWSQARSSYIPPSGTGGTTLPELIMQEERNKQRTQRAQDGLLNPELALRRTLGLSQKSSTSLGDHEDYSRPIGGFLHNSNALSTTTLNTLKSTTNAAGPGTESTDVH